MLVLMSGSFQRLYTVFSYYPLLSLGSVGKIFFISDIGDFYSLSLNSLARGFKYFVDIFERNVSWFFSIIFLFSILIDLCPHTFIFVFTLGILYSSFSRFLR